MASTPTISASTVIRGRINADADLEVHGHVEGQISAGGAVTIADGALVKSDVTAQTVHVAGAVAGNLTGSEAVVLEQGARVVGDLSAPAIGIRPGALLRGHVNSSGEGNKPALARRAAPAVQQEAVSEAPAAKPSARSAKPSARSAKPSKAPAPVMPKTSGRGKKASAKKNRARKAPAPVVPALKKRTKKAAKRRAR